MNLSAAREIKKNIPENYSVKKEYDMEARVQWKIIPQVELNKGYFFTGRIYLTKRVSHDLTEYEIECIIKTVRKIAQERNGSDYLFIFENTKDKRRIFVIDNLNLEMKAVATKAYLLANDYITLLYAEEY